MRFVNDSGTTVVLLVGIALGLAAAGVMLILGRLFNPPAPPRDPADTNPWGIGHVDDLMTLGDMANRAVRDDLASKPRIGELTNQGMLPPPLGTLPPVRQPSIPSTWRASGPASARADQRWHSGDFDRTAAELARHFREQEERR